MIAVQHAAHHHGMSVIEYILFFGFLIAVSVGSYVEYYGWHLPWGDK